MFRPYLIISGLLILILSCANERAITGGPEDKESPEIIQATPLNESVDVDLNTEILIRFNEQMQQGSFASALQIWPRPASGYEIKSSWKWLKVIFKAPLDTNETYLLTLDKSAKDLRGNGLSNPYVMAFSTGSKLNAGKIVGRIYGSQEIRKNGELFLYRKFDTDLDTLRQEPPDYIFQPDDGGNFVLPYLAERGYMLFHHWDRNRNKKIDGDDYFGRPISASVIARADSSIKANDIWPRLVKPKNLKLLKATAKASNLIRLRVNRPVTSASLEHVSVHTNLAEIPLLGSTLDGEDEFAMVFETGLALTQGDKVWLRNFTDTSGFSLSSDTIQYVIPEKMDTLVWKPVGVKWFQDNATLMPGDTQAVSLSSNLPFIITSDSAFQLVDTALDSVNIQGQFLKRNSLEWLFIPDTTLATGNLFSWEIETRFMQVPLDRSTPDSLQKGSLKTLTADSLGSIQIVQMSSGILHCELWGKDIQRQFVLEPGTPMILENLPARTYQLSGYIDKNGDKKYNSGGLGPAYGAEPFWFFPDEIKVRARWETDLGTWLLRSD